MSTCQMLRYAPRFHGKYLLKKSPKKNSLNFSWIFFSIFFLPIVAGFTANLGCAFDKFWGLGPLVWEEIENGQTVVKGLAKVLYRYHMLGSGGWATLIDCWVRATANIVSIKARAQQLSINKTAHGRKRSVCVNKSATAEWKQKSPRAMPCS
jgi:hypothetical protein